MTFERTSPFNQLLLLPPVDAKIYDKEIENIYTTDNDEKYNLDPLLKMAVIYAKCCR